MAENLKNKIQINIDNLEESRRLVIKNNYWNMEHEEILKNLKKYTDSLSKEYHKAYLRYRNKLQLYRIPIIIMSSISGFMSISNSGYIPADFTKWVSLIVGFFNLAVTVISLIENFKKIDTNMNSSYAAYINFKRLHDEIAVLMKIPQIERNENGNDTINKFFVRYQNSIIDAPILQKVSHNLLECPLESRAIQSCIKENSIISNFSIKKSNLTNSEEYDIESQISIPRTIKIQRNNVVDRNTIFRIEKETQSIVSLPKSDVDIDVDDNIDDSLEEKS
jgi:hypothetical protein